MKTASIFLLSAKNTHLIISILCYLICLILPGYYIGERFESEISFVSFMIGWLGPLDGHFAWYANPLFLLAVLCIKRPYISSALSFFALVLALSFLLHEKIIIGESPTYKTIMAYGWGYGFWVVSLFVFFIGQFLRALAIEAVYIAIVSCFACCLLLSLYATYYFVGSNSLHSIYSNRDREFDRHCISAGEQIFKKANDVRGIYLDPDWELSVSHDRDKPSFKYISSAGPIGTIILNRSQLLFYEVKDRKDSSVYVRYSRDDYDGITTDRLESEYAVTTTYYEIPARLNITGATVSIMDLRDMSIMATSTFFLEHESGRFCGNEDGYFWTVSFVTDVLNLSDKDSSMLK